MKTVKDYLNEVKATSIKQGNTFTLSADIGKFVKGDKVTVDEVKASGDDIELHLSNEAGDKDVFYLDKNDEIEGLVG
jgi:hypothetical protein